MKSHASKVSKHPTVVKHFNINNHNFFVLKVTSNRVQLGAVEGKFVSMYTCIWRTENRASPTLNLNTRCE